jgi:hypothetical protein
LTPPASSTSLPLTPPTCTGARRTAPFSTTHTELAPLFWTSADSGTRIPACVPSRWPTSTTAVIPRRTSSRAGTLTLTA